MIKCARKGCVNKGILTPQLMVSPDGVHFARGSFMTLPVCYDHKEVVTVGDLVDGVQASGETGWDLICHVFRGIHLAEPKREFSKIEWEEV